MTEEERVSDVTVDDLAEQVRQVSTIADSVRGLLARPFLRARAVRYVVQLLSTLAHVERDVLRDVLDRMGPEMRKAATDPVVAEKLRASLASFRELVTRARQYAEDSKTMYKTNPRARVYIRLRVIPALNAAADYYEDFHAFATSYLNEPKEADTVPWGDFAGTRR